MLVLSRTQGESVTLDGGIVVRVLRCRSGQVSLGFEAPPHIGIRRTEAREWQPQGADASCDVETAELEYVEARSDEESAGVAERSVAGAAE